MGAYEDYKSLEKDMEGMDSEIKLSYSLMGLGLSLGALIDLLVDKGLITKEEVTESSRKAAESEVFSGTLKALKDTVDIIKEFDDLSEILRVNNEKVEDDISAII